MNSSNKWSHGDSRPSWPHSIAQGLMLFCLWSKNSCLVIILLFCYLIREVWMWLPRTWNLSSWTIILWAEGKNCILCLNNIYIFVASVTCSGFGFPIIRVPVGFGAGWTFSPEVGFGSGSGFLPEFRGRVHESSTQPQPDPLPSPIFFVGLQHWLGVAFTYRYYGMKSSYKVCISLTYSFSHFILAIYIPLPS